MKLRTWDDVDAGRGAERHSAQGTAHRVDRSGRCLRVLRALRCALCAVHLRRDEAWVLGIAVVVAVLFLGHGLYVKATTVPTVPTYTQADIDRPLDEALWGGWIRGVENRPRTIVLQWPQEIVLHVDQN